MKDDTKKESKKKNTKKKVNVSESIDKVEINKSEKSYKKNSKFSNELVNNLSDKKQKKHSNNVLSSFAKIDENRKIIVSFIIGFLISTLLFRCILWPDRIATLKDGTQPIAKFNDVLITADDLYNDIKDAKKIDSFNILLNKIDKEILNKKYPSNEEIKKEVRELADRYYMIYEQQLGYTREQTIQAAGAKSEKDFLDSLTLDYLRNKYFDDYVLNLIDDKEIDKYYKNEVFGDIDTKHILVSIKKDDEKDGLSNEEAKKLAEEIISKLDNGTSWDDIIKEYDKQIIFEKLGFQPFNAKLEENYIKEMKSLKVDTYSKKPVLTSYGYHIIYKIAEKDKPKLNEIKDDIKELIANDMKKNDQNLGNKSLVQMRADANLEFFDSKFNDEYNESIKSFK